jgi:aldose 1-epimerase
MLQLASGDCTVTLCPETGGAVARFSWRGIDILRRVSDADLASGNARRLGMFPLVPYSNRIEHGLLQVPGATHQLRPNLEGEPHSIHGFGFQRAWEVAEWSAEHAMLELQHAPDADWPFACHVRQHLGMIGDALHLKLHLRNCGALPMPAGLGFHPYFHVGQATRLQANWDGIWDMGDDKLPTGHRQITPEQDFSHPRALDGWRSDHCYTGWDGRATLLHDGYQVRVSADLSCSKLVCFAPADGRAFVALEPVSHVNNGFALAARSIAGTGVQMLEPGASCSLSMAIAVIPG